MTKEASAPMHTSPVLPDGAELSLPTVAASPPKSTYNMDSLWADIDAKKTPRTILIKGDVVPILTDDPPFSLILRLPFNSLELIPDVTGTAVPAAKVLFDALFGPEVYVRYTNEADTEHCLGGSQMQILYTFLRSGYNEPLMHTLFTPTEADVKND